MRFGTWVTVAAMRRTWQLLAKISNAQNEKNFVWQAI
jgi:hypothetical protein